MADRLTSTPRNICWQVVPEHRDALLGPQGLRLEEWLQSRQARVVKKGAHRTVFQVVLPGLSFYVKHYPLADARAWMRQLLRSSKARAECNNALEVAGRGVPTFFPLAVGERQSLLGTGESFLITRTLENTEPLNSFLDGAWPQLPEARRARLGPRLAVAFGKLLARMHDTGIWHTDLHAGNLLVRLGLDDRPALFLIDLYSVKFRGPLDWRASRENLVMINRWFSLRVNRSDRLRFWHAYFRARTQCPELGKPPSGSANPAFLHAHLIDLAGDLERRTVDSNVEFWQRRDRRCLGNNRAFRRLRGPGIRGHAVTDLDDAALAGLIADPDEPFRRPGARLLKDSPSSTVTEFDIMKNGEPRRVIYKRFRVTAWSDPWVALVRPTAALRSWVAGHGFLERSLPTARPLAVLHRVRTGLCQERYLLCEKIDDALDLHQFLDCLESMPAPERRRLLRHAIDKVARIIRDLHRCRLSHRDLKASNVLATWGAEGSRQKAGRMQAAELMQQPETIGLLPTADCLPPSAFYFWLIDLVGVVRYRKLRRPRRVQNLARLHASFLGRPCLTRTDKVRFLRAYMQWGLQGREGWKKWWRAIERATHVKVARNKKNGRPLA